MNKRWIDDSYKVARLSLEMFSNTGFYPPTTLEYFDVIGLFETNWLTCNFEKFDKDRYGYPSNE